MNYLVGLIRFDGSVDWSPTIRINSSFINPPSLCIGLPDLLRKYPDWF